MRPGIQMTSLTWQVFRPITGITQNDWQGPRLSVFSGFCPQESTRLLKAAGTPQ